MVLAIYFPTYILRWVVVPIPYLQLIFLQSVSCRPVFPSCSATKLVAWPTSVGAFLVHGKSGYCLMISFPARFIKCNLPKWFCYYRYWLKWRSNSCHCPCSHLAFWMCRTTLTNIRKPNGPQTLVLHKLLAFCTEGKAYINKSEYYHWHPKHHFGLRFYILGF